MARFNPAWKFLQELEGGGIMHKLQGDPGGRTIWGISENNWPEMFENGPPSEEQAKRFYEAHYWYPLRLHQVQDQGIAEEIFEFAVNATPGGKGRNISVRAAQEAANVVREAAGWERIEVDGLIGRETVGALNDLANESLVHILAWDGAFNIEQLRHYRDLRSDLVKRFLHGWTRRVIL